MEMQDIINMAGEENAEYLEKLLLKDTQFDRLVCALIDRMNEIACLLEEREQDGAVTYRNGIYEMNSHYIIEKAGTEKETTADRINDLALIYAGCSKLVREYNRCRCLYSLIVARNKES